MTTNALIQWDYSDHAATYEHRADYDAAAIERMLRHVAQPQLSLAADIGAGTGKLTRPLLAAGLAVAAIEPNKHMRAIAAQIPANAAARWQHGHAELLPLAANSVDLACFGSSFNVVNAAQSLREVTRILKDDGALAILWNHRDLLDPLQAAVEAEIRAHIHEYAHGSRRADPSATVLATGQFVALDSYRCAFEYATCREDYLAAWRSHATLARAAQSQFEPIMKRIANIAPQGEFSVPYSTAVWVFRRVLA